MDTVDKTAELESLIGGSDAGLLWDAVIRARIALEFRDTDAMIGLPPTDADAVGELSEWVDRAVDRAVELGFPLALVDRADTICFSRDTARAAEAFACASAATGSGVPADLATSVTWYSKAAERGNGRAAAVAGVMTALGQGVEPDADAAVRWFDLADDLGYDWRPLAAASGLDLADE